MRNRRFYVKLNGKKNRWRNQENGLPQWSVLSPLLFNVYTNYERHNLRANPDKTQTCVFNLKNREAGSKLNITWYNKHPEHIPNPVYLGVTLDITLSYKEHIHTMKCKRSARNNILRKLSNTKWGAKLVTIKTTALAFCYSTAKYACPVWEMSTHVSKLDTALNQACRSVTGCLRHLLRMYIALLVLHHLESEGLPPLNKKE